MRTGIAVALTIVAAILAIQLFTVSEFENRKPVATIYATESGEGYCAMDGSAERGNIAVMSSSIAGDCHAETVDTVIHAKRKTIIIGIVEQPCSRGQPCRFIVLEPAQRGKQRPTVTLRE